MAGLIPIPDPEKPGETARLWINPAHVVTAAAIVDRVSEPHHLFVELKLRGLNLTRYLPAVGDDDEPARAWTAFAVQP